jgi:hypothetical protein
VQVRQSPLRLPLPVVVEPVGRLLALQPAQQRPQLAKSFRTVSISAKIW